MRVRWWLVLAGLVLLTGACGVGAQPPLGAVRADPPPPSPEQRDQRNRVDVHYWLNRAATVSTRIVSVSGSQWVIHQDAPRPVAGEYVMQFDGTVDGPGANERRALPDGDYQIVLDVQAGNQRQAAQVPVTIQGVDAAPPEISDLELSTDRITPNFDALDDIARVSYHLSKDAQVSGFVDAVSSSGQPTRVWSGEQTSVLAGEQSLRWDGLAGGQPVPDGSYVLGIRARDAAGNVVEAGRPLQVEDAGVPDASIVSARIGPLQIIAGGQVCIDAIVRNTGQTVLHTEGPDQGYVYNSLDTFASIQNHAFAAHGGLWRLGLNWSTTTDVTGATYPYRWSLGGDLNPGDETTVHGCVQVLEQRQDMVFFAGLVQENVAIHAAGAGLVRVSISS